MMDSSRRTYQNKFINKDSLRQIYQTMYLVKTLNIFFSIHRKHRLNRTLNRTRWAVVQLLRPSFPVSAAVAIPETVRLKGDRAWCHQTAPVKTALA